MSQVWKLTVIYCHARKCRNLIVIFLSVWLLAANASAIASDDLVIIRSLDGDHSIKQLGNEFTVPVKTRYFPESEPVLIDYGLAADLGFRGSDIEDQLRKKFSFLVDAKAGEKEFFATYYNHYNGFRGENFLTGDGRVFWVGEIVLRDLSGKYSYLDVTVKGGGATVLAQGKSGMQSMTEATNSFIISKRNASQGFNTSRDLVVFKLPFSTDKGKDSAALTVRVGNQLRPATMGYFATDVTKSHKIFDYMAKRALGLAPEVVVGSLQRQSFISLFVSNLAEQAARTRDAYFNHGMMHDSNVKGDGGTIDFGTSRQAYVGISENFTPEDHVALLESYSGITDPAHQSENQILELYKKIGKAPSTDLYKESEIFLGRRYRAGELLKDYFKIFNETRMKLSLKRMGLTSMQIAKNPVTSKNFFRSIFWHFIGSDTHNLLRLAPALYARKASDTEYAKALFQSELFSNPRDLSEYFEDEYSREEFQDLLKPIKSVLAQFNKEELLKMKEIAELTFPKRRISPGVSKYENPFDEPKSKNLYEKIQSGESSVRENSHAVEEIVSETRHRVRLEDVEIETAFRNRCPDLLKVSPDRSANP